jgi:PEP-CTERM motif
MAWRSLFPGIMLGAEPLPSRRGRRIFIALLIVLLILLPLYLWPLLGGPGTSPGASALSWALRDPRSAVALARIPGAVWDTLMGHADEPAPPAPPPTKAPRNLTMITQVGERPDGGFDPDLGAAQILDGPAALARGMLAQLGGPSDPSDGKPAEGAGPSTPVESLATGTGTGHPASGFGYPSLGSLDPWHGGSPGGGPRFTSPGPTFAADDPGALEPTPEPATLVLVGFNLALLGVAAWKRRRRLEALRSGDKIWSFSNNLGRIRPLRRM